MTQVPDPMSSSKAMFSLPGELEPWLILAYVAAVLLGARLLERLARSHFARADRYAREGFVYDPVNDFGMVTLVASVPYWLVVHPSVPVKSVKELIALAKRRPGDSRRARGPRRSRSRRLPPRTHRPRR